MKMEVRGLFVVQPLSGTVIREARCQSRPNHYCDKIRRAIIDRCAIGQGSVRVAVEEKVAEGVGKSKRVLLKVFDRRVRLEVGLRGSQWTQRCAQGK